MHASQARTLPRPADPPADAPADALTSAAAVAAPTSRDRVDPMPPAAPPTPDQAAAAILESVPLAMRSIRARMREGRPAGMSVAQFRALLFVRRNPGSPLSAIAEHLGTSVPAASELVSRLVREGLLARETDPSERRRIRLTLTVAGTEQLAGAQRGAMAWLAERVAPLPPERLGAVVEALGDLRRALGSAESRPGDDPPPGPAQRGGDDAGAGAW